MTLGRTIHTNRDVTYRTSCPTLISLGIMYLRCHSMSPETQFNPFSCILFTLD